MSTDEQIDALITQTINGAIATIPAYMEDINQNKNKLKIDNPREFVYGMVMGMALGMSGAVLSAQKEAPSTEDQLKVRDIIYRNMPQVRERIFE